MKSKMINKLSICIITLLIAHSVNCSGSDGENGTGDPADVNVTGTWDGTWKSNYSSDLSGVFSANIVQTENNLTGSITIYALGFDNTEIAGSIDGNNITFGDINGIISFSGTINGEIDTGQGTYTSQQYSDGTWAASCTREFNIDDTIDISSMGSVDSTGLASNGTDLYLSEGSQIIDKLDMNGNCLESLIFQDPVRDFESLAFDGSYLWGTDAEADKICKIDLHGNVISEYESPSGEPHYISGPIQMGIASDGVNLWVLDYNTGKIHRMDQNGNFHESFQYPEDETGWAYPTGFGYANGYLWMSTPDGMTGIIYKIDISTGKNVRRYCLPLDESSNSWPGDIASDSTSMWIVDYDYIYKISENE